MTDSQINNLLNSAFPKRHNSSQKDDDGIALKTVPHPGDFPWHFVHKLWNVMRRNRNE